MNTIKDEIKHLYINPEKTFKENFVIGEELIKDQKLLIITARGRANSLCIDVAIALMRQHDKNFKNGKTITVTTYTDIEPHTKKKVTRIEIPLNKTKQ